MSGYRPSITAVTEELMRVETGGCLDHLDRARGEAKSRPRQRKLGRGHWLCDHPRQQSIYPLSLKIAVAR